MFVCIVMNLYRAGKMQLGRKSTARGPFATGPEACSRGGLR
jgi:hypothetical protein